MGIHPEVMTSRMPNGKTLYKQLMTAISEVTGQRILYTIEYMQQSKDIANGSSWAKKRE